MAKRRPAIMLYKGDWRKDPELSMCSPATRGIWIDLICAMDDAEDQGRLSGTLRQLAQVARCTWEEMAEAVLELQETRAAHVTGCNGKNVTCNSRVTVENRRMVREAQDREKTRLRVARHRRKKADSEECNGEVSSSRARSVAVAVAGSSGSSSSSGLEEPTSVSDTLSVPLPGTDGAPKDEKASAKLAVDQVWTCYLDAHRQHHAEKNGQAPPPPKLTGPRRQLILQRLRDGYPPSDQCRAIRGMFATPHNLGQNDRATEYLGIEIALRVNRDGNNLERFRDSAPRPQRPVNKDPHSPERHGVANTAGKLYDSRQGRFVEESEWTPLTEGASDA